jgi:AraC family transcriptional regulator, transcriptional activator of the genes for pyochelin and ferripyochelin receptors
MLTKTNGISLTEADFVELEEEAKQQGELLYREIELGTDAYLPSALGKMCDRFIDLREGLTINIRSGNLSQALTLERQHEEDFSIVAKFYLSGSSRVTTPQVPEINPDYEEIAGGNYLYYLPNMTEYEQWQANSPIHVVMVYAPPEYFSNFNNTNGVLPPPLQVLMRDAKRFHQSLGQISPTMLQVLQQILYCPYQGITQQLYLESKALELLALQFTCLEADISTPKQPLLKSRDLERVQYAKEILVKNLNKPPSLKQLTHQTGLSDRKLQQGFHYLFGTTVFGYFHNYRLEQAQYLLHQPHATVGQVATQIGYRNPEAFSTAFRRKFGINPKAYQLGRFT